MKEENINGLVMSPEALKRKRRDSLIKEKLSRVRRKILVMSGKGGDRLLLVKNSVFCKLTNSGLKFRIIDNLFKERGALS